MKDLYIHQTNYLSVDEKKQKRLREARVAIVGLGGPGSGVAEQLARAGVGALRLIDRDAVVLKDLPQQTLYTEEDAVQNLFKARALAEKLEKSIPRFVWNPWLQILTPTIAGTSWMALIWSLPPRTRRKPFFASIELALGEASPGSTARSAAAEA